MAKKKKKKKAVARKAKRAKPASKAKARPKKKAKKKKVAITAKSLRSPSTTKGLIFDSDTKPQGDDLLTDNIAAKIYADDASKATGDAD
jgi:hypothetical protein